MPTIARIELNNFMSFREQVVNLAPGINVVAGANRQGKTNVLRALKWVLLNDGPPYSDNNDADVLRHGRGQSKAPVASVRVVYDNGAWVERRRGKSENLYILHFADGHEEEYSGIGQGFYEPVAQITGFAPVSTGSNEKTVLGWQGVNDPKLLVGESAAVIDRQLTRMIGTNTLEAAVSLAHAEVADGRKQLKTVEKQAAAIDEQLAALEGLEAAGALCQQAEELEAEASKLDAAVTTGSSIVAAMGPVIDRAVALGAGLPAAGAHTERVLGLLTACTEHHNLLLSASELADRLQAAVAKGAAADRLLPTLDVQLAACGVALEAASTIHQSIDRVGAVVNDLEQVKQRSEQVAATLGSETTAQDELKKQIDAELERNPACPHCGRVGVCPHCGQRTEAVV